MNSLIWQFLFSLAFFLFAIKWSDFNNFNPNKPNVLWLSLYAFVRSLKKYMPFSMDESDKFLHFQSVRLRLFDIFFVHLKMYTYFSMPERKSAGLHQNLFGTFGNYWNSMIPACNSSKFEYYLIISQFRMSMTKSSIQVNIHLMIVKFVAWIIKIWMKTTAIIKLSQQIQKTLEFKSTYVVHTSYHIQKTAPGDICNLYPPNCKFSCLTNCAYTVDDHHIYSIDRI